MSAGAVDMARKRERFSIRASEDEKVLVEQAAAVSRVSTSRFVMQAALRSAEEVLADQTRFALGPEEWAAFTEQLDRPARTIPALRQAAAKTSPFE